MSSAVRAWVALGTNLGEREDHLAWARERLGGLPGTTLLGASSIEETKPLGDIPQPDYLNQMVLLETTLPPDVLLEACLEIERETGRVRGPDKWGPRTLDLDIVRYDDLSLRGPGLTLPHPGLEVRDWWQREMKELARYER
ncbi:MAG TPA: 2-amino-4-hydroxy-6-hydroxymethyldihydropteridine diphosphokinase [Gemmatimonadales bacterium]|nr:2-amino-4-hydroxy-6-hydroxymethyldihydropteridine diphosphokinase [Gemmatimonadales bacterium]